MDGNGQKQNVNLNPEALVLAGMFSIVALAFERPQGQSDQAITLRL